MSKLLFTALAAVILAAPAFAQGPYGPNPDPTNLNVTLASNGTSGQGVYSLTPPQETASETVNLNITPYSHVSLERTVGPSYTIAPGGDGDNVLEIRATRLLLATNRDVSENNVVQVNVEGAGGAAEFDELNFGIRFRGIYTQRDMASDGARGSMTPQDFTFADNGTAKDMITGFGQVVAFRDMTYNIAVSDVAEQGARQFTVTYTISPF